MSSAALILLSYDLRNSAAPMEAGADYVLPPPSPPALINAPIQAVQRRRQAERCSGGRVGELGPPLVEPSRRSARSAGRRHLLSPREADLLEYSALNVAVVLSRRQIIEGVWGGDRTATLAGVAGCVHRLRLKLEADLASPHLLPTLRGDGYVLQRPAAGGA